ncbi:MAG: AsmA family protein [Bacteroidales bacterium]|jgi:hypothetical protein|nr:AsmA family protein [Bacteroidales bacterium]
MKFLKRILITILVIFVLLLVTPFLFKGKIVEIAKSELNKMLMAKVDFAGLKLSFIRNFPNAYVALEDLTVIGTDEFEGDTLVAFKKLSVTVDIMSVIKMDNIQVKSVLLDQAKLYAHVLDNGHVNWDIMKPSDETEVTPEDTSSSTFKVALKKFEIRQSDIIYRDDSSKMAATVKDLNFHLRGDMTQDNVDLDMELGIAEVNFWMDGIRMLKKARVGFVSEIAADLKNMSFTFRDNQFNLNEIVLNFAGSVHMPADDINMDLTFATDKTDFKSLLSLIPAIYMKDFESVKTTGSLTLNGDLKGTYNNRQMPGVHLNMTVDNAMFKYPDLPKSVDKINIAAKLFYDGAVFDRTTADIDKFHFEMAGNPFDAELHVKTPDSDMQVTAAFAGKIDFNSLSDIIPLDSITLKGLLECDLSLAGRMSTLEKEQYEDFNAGGMLKLSGFDLESPDFPQGVKITSTQLNFTPQKVDLVNFDAIIGRTDVALNGALENFIPYVFKNETIRGKLALKSNTIDLNEFMTDETSETAAADTVPMSVIEVPKNIDFTMNASIGKILFDKLTITNTTGVLLVKDGKVRMQNLGMNLLEGSMVLNGEYNTQDIKVPSVDFGMDIRQFDITSALSSFSMLEKILPEPQNYAGKVSANLTLYSVLDENLSPVLNTVASKGVLQTQNVEIRNSKLFGTMADLLKDEKWRTPVPGNLNIKYEIKDGRLTIDPIHMNISQAKVELTGDQGLDMTLNYKVNVAVPVSSVGSAAVDLLGKIPGGSSIKEFKVTGLIGGTATKPDVKLSIADMAGNITEAVKTQVTEAVTQKVEEVKTQVKEEVNKQVDALMEEVQKQADNIRSNAKKTADNLRTVANTNADKLEKDAASKSAIEQRLAKAAADKLRKEGEANAVKIEQEGEKQATATIDAAQKKADELKSK